MGYQQIETTNNKVLTLNSLSTDGTYPSSKAVYDLVNSNEIKLISLNNQKLNLLNGVSIESDDTAASTTNAVQFLHVTDIHNDLTSLRKAVILANNFPSITAILVTGDIVNDQYSKSQLDDAVEILNECTKPWYPVVGNHEACNSTIANLSMNWIMPGYYHLLGENNIVLPEANNPTYYYADFDNLRLIVLDQFDGLPNREPENTGEAFTAMSQTQLQWFVNTLSTTPANHGIVIALHATTVGRKNTAIVQQPIIQNSKKFCANDTYSSSWGYTYLWPSQMCYTNWGTTMYTLLHDIVSAYLNKQNKSFAIDIYDYTFTTAVTQFTLSCQFATLSSTGKFMAWLGGHNHRDLILSYNNQNQILPVCSSSSPYQMEWADMPKDGMDYSNIAFTVETFHPSASTPCIDLVRLGQDQGNSVGNLTYITRDYERINV